MTAENYSGVAEQGAGPGPCDVSFTGDNVLLTTGTVHIGKDVRIISGLTIIRVTADDLKSLRAMLELRGPGEMSESGKPESSASPRTLTDAELSALVALVQADAAGEGGSARDRVRVELERRGVLEPRR